MAIDQGEQLDGVHIGDADLVTCPRSGQVCDRLVEVLRMAGCAVEYTELAAGGVDEGGYAEVLATQQGDPRKLHGLLAQQVIIDGCNR